MNSVQVQMLGEFSLQCGDKIISDSTSRSKKVWLLLACLLCNRGRVVPQQKIIEMLWGDDASSDKPENALRITLHRLRGLLDGLWPNAGHELILKRDGGYCWNDSIETECDYERFEALCQSQAEDEEQRLKHRLEALQLYKGDFLAKHSSELWIIPLSTHLHNLFVLASIEAAELLSAQGRHEQAAQCCRNAIAVEPYNEKLVQLLMQELGHMAKYSAAAAAYEALSQRLFSDFGIHPSEETRNVYRSTVHSPAGSALPMDKLLEQLQEKDIVPGAMQCDYDYFKVLCFAESRAMERSGNVAHVALLSVSAAADKPLARRSLEHIMELLGETIRTNLRRGDCFSRCSVSQYIIMLPGANYENSCMVCRRCLGAFRKALPHMAVKISFMVQPLAPSLRVP